MQRISVVGMSGSGKTTLARELGARLGLPVLELDSIFHLPNWGERPTDEFLADISRFTEAESWVVDGNYHGRGAQDLIWARADTVVWLDHRKARVMWQVVIRSLARAVTKDELWPGTGNRERFRNLLTHDHPIRWSWRHYARNRLRNANKLAEERHAHLAVVRLRGRRATQDWLAEVARRGPS